MQRVTVASSNFPNSALRELLRHIYQLADETLREQRAAELLSRIWPPARLAEIEIERDAELLSAETAPTAMPSAQTHTPAHRGSGRSPHRPSPRPALEEHQQPVPGIHREIRRESMTRTTTRAKALALTMTVPVVLLAGGCKSGSSTTYTGPVPAISAPASQDPGFGASGTGVQPVPADAAPVDYTCPARNTTAFAKTKFVAHTGLAFGAFRQWLYKPYTAGTFKKGSKGRVKAIVKAGVAALFIKRAIRLAAQDVKASPLLCKTIAKPLAQVSDRVQGTYNKLRTGDPTSTDSDVTSLQASIAAIETQAKQAGDTITENTNADIYSIPR